MKTCIINNAYNFRMAQVMQWPPAIRNYMSVIENWLLHVDTETKPSKV